MASGGAQLAFRSGTGVKVAVVCPYDLSAPGGVQQLTTELADHLRGQGHQVILVGAGKAEYEGGPGRDGTTVPVGRAVSVRGNRSTARVSFAPTTIHMVGRVLRDVDVVHVHEPLIPLIGWSALRSQKPMVATFHADPPGWVETFYRMPGLAGRMRRAVLTAVSSAAARAIPAGWGEVDLIPNAIDVGSYSMDVGRVSRRVAFLGRDEPRKGLDVLLKAWPEVTHRVGDAELVVLGASREEQIDGVSFRGRVSEGEKRRLLASSTVYVAPNLGGESFGIVLAEAMAAGCAVVASDIPSFRDVVRGAGMMATPGDASGLAEAIAALLEDRERASELGERARASVVRFDWSSVLDQYLAVYRRAISL